MAVYKWLVCHNKTNYTYHNKANTQKSNNHSKVSTLHSLESTDNHSLWSLDKQEIEKASNFAATDLADVLVKASQIECS